ncbi:hypothetical protein JYB62_04935 [Algoriphagus lutimaris]|uniref:hypothetical protein n=1 Tax=Algoriphagus lutimaris TaxID=613197 RepID=UPI00196A9C87|nr:hypothetical protein [Algoriphagus lutimaris]MBN3519339.1 hypothetical protein [Algoriphagus lutimaris]
MKDETNSLVQGIKRVTDYSEGLTSLLAGTYVLSLALIKGNVALRIALGVAGGYLILRSGTKLHSLGKENKVLE